MQFRGLRARLMISSLGALALYYTLACIVTFLFMEPYYLHKVQRRLVSAYTELREIDSFTTSMATDLEKKGVSIVLADRDSHNIIYNSHVPPHLMADMMDRILPYIEERASFSDSGYYLAYDEMEDHTEPGAAVRAERRLMVGGINDKYIMEFSTPYTSISSATTQTAQFSLAIGLASMVLAVLFSSRTSSVLTRPIKRITNVAEQIANLDFSQSCDSSIGGEIGQMADSINIMSDFMQSHILQLEEANRQLQLDIQAKVEQEEARKTLVANLSHDLKTPIGLISGYADGLRTGMVRSNSEIKEYCDVICDEADRMTELVQRMTELFRLESGGVTLEAEDFDLSDLLQYLCDVFALEIARQNIRFTQSCPGSLYIHSDYFAVEQVLTNYFQNAITYISAPYEMRLWTETGDGVVRILLYNSAQIDPETDLTRIWDRFYRLDPSRTRSRQNYGLGLTIVKSNMDLIGGACGARREEGGITFWAEFPSSRETDSE